MKSPLERQLLRAGAAESLADHLQFLLAAHRITCVVDVGANEGEYGLFVRSLGFEGLIVSFEPAAEAFEGLARVASADGNWMVENRAIAAGRGKLALHVANDNVFSSLLRVRETTRERFGEAAGQDREEEVEAIALRELGRDVGPVLNETRCLLKVDAQGSEQRVLEGLGGSFERPRLLQVEMGVDPLYEGAPGHLDLLTALEEKAYVPTGFFPVNRDEGGALVEFDGVFLAR